MPAPAAKPDARMGAPPPMLHREASFISTTEMQREARYRAIQDAQNEQQQKANAAAQNGGQYSQQTEYYEPPQQMPFSVGPPYPACPGCPHNTGICGVTTCRLQ